MMKKIVLGLICCTVMLMLLCASSALADARVSITELAQSTPDYWESPLVVDGEQVMVPVYVPDVERIPIIKAKWKHFSDEEMILTDEESNGYNGVMGDFSISKWIEEGTNSKKTGTFTRACINALWQEKWSPTIASADIGTQIWDTPSAMTCDTTYAEGQAASLRDAMEFARAHLELMFAENSGFQLFFEQAIIYSCLRERLEDSTFGAVSPRGELTGVGGYGLRGCLAFRGIPVFSAINYAYQGDTTNSANFKIGRIPSFDFYYYSENNYSIGCTPWTETEILYEDVPLCSFEKVITAIQRQIDNGRVVDVFSIKLGYVVFASQDEKYPSSGKDEVWGEANPQFTMIPTWVCECSYKTNSSREYSSKESSKTEAYDYTSHNWFYASLMINAQTGELYDPQSSGKENLYTPQILTW